MRVIRVSLSQNAYEVQIGAGLLNQVGERLRGMGFKGKAVIITNPVVKRLYGGALKANLEAAGFIPVTLEVPDGEEYKSLEQAAGLYELLSQEEVERGTPLLALGGGVIGDLGGFVAATYMRGVPLFQLPTTLLAQVDSSIGGKTAINYGGLKNIVGAFYQPRLVMSDVATLKTLPESEFGNGMAEVIKYAVIRNEGVFRSFESTLDRLKALDAEILEEVVSRCVAIKAAIVEKDEKDLGLRNILNYGHTVGHAIEAVSDFHLGHGRAVAIGMVAAARISREMGFLPQSELERIESLVALAGLPENIPGLDVESIMQAMQHDKKKVGDRIRFVLPRAIGEVFVSDEVDSELAKQVLEDLRI
jgi:3-dehydroquinate synthase